MKATQTLFGKRCAEYERVIARSFGGQDLNSLLADAMDRQILERSAGDAQRGIPVAIALCKQSDQTAAVGCMKAFGTTDFRADLPRVDVPTLVIHGDADGVVPLEGSGARTHRAIAGSELVVLPGAPHGLNVSHADAFNEALIRFLGK